MSYQSIALPLAVVLLLGLTPESAQAKDPPKEKEDPYAEYVWPPPPDEGRIKLEDIFSGRADVEAESKFKKFLIGASPASPYDNLEKPHAVAYDPQGRILVTDWATKALLRFDRKEGKLDILGTRGTLPLQQPLGLAVSSDGTIYVADVGLNRVLAFDPEGKLINTFGSQDELENPTDAAPSPDGTKLYVADSKGQEIVIFDLKTTERLSSFGSRGTGEGEFNFPTSIAFGPEGNLYVVDQLNARIQIFAPDGEFLDMFGHRGRGTGSFTRPKDVAVDEVGFIYVVDNAFNNVQLFDIDFSLLTFVGQGGEGPGRFFGASGIAVHGDEFAVVDQIGHRVQVFRFIVPKDS